MARPTLPKQTDDHAALEAAVSRGRSQGRLLVLDVFRSGGRHGREQLCLCACGEFRWFRCDKLPKRRSCGCGRLDRDGLPKEQLRPVQGAKHVLSVARLRPVIDRKVREHGYDPETQAAMVAVILRDKWQSVQWAEVALEAGLSAVDFDLRWAVIHDYKERSFRYVDCFITDPVRDGRGAP